MLGFKSCTSTAPRVRTPACQVCLEPYDGKLHTPKILQCAHTVCQSCMNALEEQGRRRVPNLEQTMVSVSCPICRTITQTSRCCIRTNYQLIDVVEAYGIDASHSVAFVSCTQCEMVYHEKDINICTKCTPIDATTTASELLSREVSLHQFAICSTCILNDHMNNGHGFIRMQPLRIEMQREENARRIVAEQEKLAQVQLRFREQLEQTMAKWLEFGGNHEANMNLFRAAQTSFQQKVLYEKFSEEISKKSAHIEKLLGHIQEWNRDMEPRGNAAMEEAEPNVGGANQHPEFRQFRPATPLNNQDDMVYYFER
ncbi:hypothetical protein L5515_000304 [Caenorhabditis briggsae]|uniref:RING-type domain-containing protein n=1 Tax=Caenorhabditis briggsae TaxID=6238 RepID=A0AAE9E1Z4_CAEBR|nr:hypothetical protein L5515_000304 [Caenorhabditis briggsae]